jgi:hypothetical protein
VVSERLRHLLVELGEVVFDHSQFIERQLHQPAIHRMKIRAGIEGVAQLLGRCSQSLVGQSGQRPGSAAPSLATRSMHRALVPISRVATLQHQASVTDHKSHFADAAPWALSERDVRT